MDKFRATPDIRVLFTGGAFLDIDQEGIGYPSVIDATDASEPWFQVVPPKGQQQQAASQQPWLLSGWWWRGLEKECQHHQTASPTLTPTAMSCKSVESVDWGVSHGHHLTRPLSPSDSCNSQRPIKVPNRQLHGRLLHLQGLGCCLGSDLVVQKTNTAEHSASRNSAAPTQPSPLPRKRSRGEGGWPSDGHMNPSESDERPHKTRKTKPTADERSRVILACPFYKRDPGRYRSCRRFFLTKISYVKQHILRSHRMPPHCQICNRLFQTDEQQLEHVRSQSCDRQPYNPPEGVTQAQIALLRGRVDQKKSLEGQWYEIYEILFPGAQRPSSVYLDPELSQDLDEFTNFLTSRGPAILLSRVNFDGVERSAASGESLVSEVSSALQDVYDEWYRTRTRDAPEPRETLTPGSVPTTPSTTAGPSYISESATNRQSVLAQPSDRPLSIAGSNRHETLLPSFATSSSAFDSPTTNAAADVNRPGRSPQPPPAGTVAHLATGLSSLKRTGEAEQGGEHRRKSPRPAAYKPGGSSGPGSLADREGVRSPSRPDG